MNDAACVKDKPTPLINQRLGGIMSAISDKEANLERIVKLFQRITGREVDKLSERPKWEENIHGCLSIMVEYMSYLEHQTTIYLGEIEEYI